MSRKRSRGLRFAFGLAILDVMACRCRFSTRFTVESMVCAPGQDADPARYGLTRCRLAFGHSYSPAEEAARGN